jgi:hypothetical protein
VGVVSGDKGKCVPLTGELARLLNGRVEHDGLSQCLIRYAFVVTVVNAAPCKEQVGGVTLGPALGPPPLCSARPQDSPSTKRKKPWGFLLSMCRATSVTSSKEGSWVWFR